MKHIYIVIYCDSYGTFLNVSQECYKTFEDAKKFIEGRTGFPKQKFDSWEWEVTGFLSEHCVVSKYIVKELVIKESKEE